MFEPGKSGNPRGRPKTDAEVKELMAYSRNVLFHAMAKYIAMSSDEIKEVLEHKDQMPQIDLLILSCISGARDRKDIKRLELLFHYILGKPKEVVQHEVEEIRVRLIRASQAEKEGEEANVDSVEDGKAENIGPEASTL